MNFGNPSIQTALKTVPIYTDSAVTPRVAVTNASGQNHATIPAHVVSAQAKVVDRKSSRGDFQQSYPMIAHSKKVNTNITSPVITTMRKAQKKHDQ